MEKTFEILNDEGLHARPAGILAKTANEFTCDIELEFNQSKVNAKSVMTLMSLGLTKGSHIKIIANGQDEKNAIDTISTLIENKFNV